MHPSVTWLCWKSFWHLGNVRARIIGPPGYDLRSIVDLLEKYGDAHISDSEGRIRRNGLNRSRFFVQLCLSSSLLSVFS